MKKINHIIVKILLTFILSIFFYVCISDLRFDIYMLCYDCILATVMFAYLRLENAKYLLSIMVLSFSNALAYFIIHKLYFPETSLSLYARTNLQIILCVIALIEIVIIFIVWLKAKKENNGSKPDKSIIFPERKYDFERIKLYLDKVNVIGINSCWGSGKSFLMNRLCEEYKDRYEIIKIELLTCNQDDIIIFLFQELEAVLKRHRIFPIFSRRLQNIMTDNDWLKKLQPLLFQNREDKTSIFDGFGKDIQKLNKPVMLIYEDIERITDVDVIKRIFDLSEKLSNYNIKIVYEFDQFNMNKLELDRRYLEKYIPYIINLTEISCQTLLMVFFDELNMAETGVEKKDFDFLFRVTYGEWFLEKIFGFSLQFSMEINHMAARKMKSFLEELKIMLKLDEFSDKENRETVITFYFLKHFFYELYQELPFKQDFWSEVQFHNSINKKDYTLMELLTERQMYDTAKDADDKEPEVGLSKYAVKQMFYDDEYLGIFNEDNRCKFVFIILFGYKVQFQCDKIEEEKRLSEGNRKNRGQNWLDIRRTVSTNDIENYYHNDKISHLIKNLHASGKSENTDKEAAAEKFMKEVINKDPWEQDLAWKKYCHELYEGNIYKDSKTIFVFGGDFFVELFKSFHVLFEKEKWKKAKEETKQNWIKLLDFYFKDNSFNGRITKDFLACCYYCCPNNKDVYLKVIQKFNSLEIIGNMNYEKVYINFLQVYYKSAYILGYFSRFRGWEIEFKDADDRNISYIESFLKDCCHYIEKDIESGIFPESVVLELHSVSDFLKKNLELIKTERAVSREGFQVRSSIEEKWIYVNEEIYNRLNSETDLPYLEYKSHLDKEYQNNNISLQEMRRLIDIYKAINNIV